VGFTEKKHQQKKKKGVSEVLGVGGRSSQEAPNKPERAKKKSKEKKR